MHFVSNQYLIIIAQTRRWYVPCNSIISCSPLSLLLFYSEVKWNAVVMKHLFQNIYYKKDTRQVFVSTDFISGFIEIPLYCYVISCLAYTKLTECSSSGS
jgi:hypothetical protein